MPDTPRCILLGGGGHARVLIDCLQSGGAAIPVAILDADEALWGETILNVPVIGGDEKLEDVRRDRIETFVVGLGSVADAAPRRRLFDLGLSFDLGPVAVRHPSAICSHHAELGAGCQLLPGSIVNAGARLGRNVIINTGATVEHDCVLGDHVHVATGASLTGTVTIGEGALIGAGAIVRHGVSVGENAIVGAGAVVVADVSPGVTVTGVPARASEAE